MSYNDQHVATRYGTDDQSLNCRSVDPGGALLVQSKLFSPREAAALIIGASGGHARVAAPRSEFSFQHSINPVRIGQEESGSPQTLGNDRRRILIAGAQRSQAK